MLPPLTYFGMLPPYFYNTIFKTIFKTFFNTEVQRGEEFISPLGYLSSRGIEPLVAQKPILLQRTTFTNRITCPIKFNHFAYVHFKCRGNYITFHPFLLK